MFIEMYIKWLRRGNSAVGLFPHERFQTAKADYSCRFRHRDIKLAATPASSEDARRSEHVGVGNNLFSPSIPGNISSGRVSVQTTPPPLAGDVTRANLRGRTPSAGSKEDSKVSSSKRKPGRGRMRGGSLGLGVPASWRNGPPL